MTGAGGILGGIVLYLDTAQVLWLHDLTNDTTVGSTLMGVSPDPRRILPVAPLIADKRCYGEYPARVRRGDGEAAEGYAGLSGVKAG